MPLPPRPLRSGLHMLGATAAALFGLAVPAAAVPFNPATAVFSAPASLHGSVNRAPGYLGIESRDASPSATAGAHGGVEVLMVDHDGPAGKAGLRPHDVILSVNGQELAGADALRRMVHDSGAGAQMSMAVLRDGHPLTLTTRLADRQQVARAAMARVAADPAAPPAPAPGAPITAGEGAGLIESYTVTAVSPLPQPTPAPASHGFLSSMLHGEPLLGVELEAMEPQLAVYFGAPQGAGLLVHAVVAGSPGACAGLRAGDVVLNADMVPLRSTTEWSRHMRGAKGRPVTLLVLRDHRELMMTMPPELKHHSLLEWPGKTVNPEGVKSE